MQNGRFSHSLAANVATDQLGEKDPPLEEEESLTEDAEKDPLDVLLRRKGHRQSRFARTGSRIILCHGTQGGPLCDNSQSGPSSLQLTDRRRARRRLRLRLLAELELMDANYIDPNDLAEAEVIGIAQDPDDSWFYEQSSPDDDYHHDAEDDVMDMLALLENLRAAQEPEAPARMTFASCGGRGLEFFIREGGQVFDLRSEAELTHEVLAGERYQGDLPKSEVIVFEPNGSTNLLETFDDECVYLEDLPMPQTPAYSMTAEIRELIEERCAQCNAEPLACSHRGSRLDEHEAWARLLGMDPRALSILPFMIGNGGSRPRRSSLMRELDAGGFQVFDDLRELNRATAV